MSCIGFEVTIRMALTKQLPVLSVSDGIEDLLGFKVDDFLSSSVSLRGQIHAHDAEGLEELFCAQNPSSSGSRNLRFRDLAGRICPMQVTFTRSTDAEGEAVLELHLQDARSLSPTMDPRSALGVSIGLMNTLDDFIYFKDRHHVIRWANEKFVQAFTDRPKFGVGLQGVTDYDLFPEAYADANYDAEEKIFAGGPTEDAIRETVLGEKQQYRAGFRQFSVRDAFDAVVGVACVSPDLTHQLAAEEALRASEQTLRQSQRIAGIGSYVLDMPAGTWTSSEVLDELFGIDKQYERTLAGWNALIHSEDRNRIAAVFSLGGIAEGSGFEQEYRILRKADRAERWVRGQANKEFDAAGQLKRIRGTVQDITKLKEAARELEFLAHYDALTGLPNRMLLVDRVQQSMVQLHRRTKRMALAYLDLDGFKTVNEKHGREAGDELLKALASRMHQVLRRGDTIARLGGDEFVVLVHDLVNEAASVPTLARLLNAASEPILIGNSLIKVSASIGVAFYPQQEELDADQLMRQADHSMYQAKLLGRNRYCMFDAVQDSAVRGQQEALERIRKGLNAQEFVMYYQPKVNMSQGKVVGVEALIRWQHPEKGLLPAGAFLPLIENHPLAEVLGTWVIGSVLAQMEVWVDSGLDIPVSINVGGRQLRQPDFVASLGKLLAQHARVDPAKVELEIQGSSAPQYADTMEKLQEGCRALGVTIALHRFGYGSSTLNDLKNSAASIFKIDQGFVRDILDDPKERSILEGVLGLAAAFSRQSLVEGVESAEHGLAVLRMGCELAQGYGIAYPMPAAELAQWVAEWRPDPRWAQVALEGKEVHPLLRAESEHLAWMVSLENFLKGDCPTAPQLGRHQCKLGTWLDAENVAGRGSQPEFQAIVALHWRIHALATGVLKLKAQSRAEEALNRIGEMAGLLDRMFEHLRALKPII